MIDGVKIGWVSGNYSPKDFTGDPRNGKYHHFRADDLEKVLNEKSGIDVLLIHDWPSVRRLQEYIVRDSVVCTGNLDQAIKRNLGNDPLYELVMQVRPKYVFCGHMHLPLRFSLKIDNDVIKFEGLSIVGQEGSVCTLDTEKIGIDSYQSRTGD